TVEYHTADGYLERLPALAADLMRRRPAAIIAIGRAALAAKAATRNIAAVSGVSSFAANGGLMSYDSDSTERYRGAAIYVDRLLRGAKVSDLPVQYPTKFRLMINLKTAKALGLTIPESFLLRADEVIE